MRAVAKIFLLLAGWLIVVSIVSNSFDNDLGWHLRFGQDALSGDFQYTDSYTWGFAGREWVNHEWGADILFWIIYSRVGYFALALLIGTVIWAAFVLAPLIFARFSLGALAISLLMALAAGFTFVTRVSMAAPLFFVLLWFSLERKKYFFLWPILFWAWSFLHGSWILGFILINIYLVGEIIPSTIRACPELVSGGGTKGGVGKKLCWQIISAAAILLNPYGIKLWREVLSYFIYSDYKRLIIEWLPSYSYPIRWWPIIIAGAAGVLLYLGWKNKKASLTHVLLFLAIFLAAMQYKRNNILLTLVCAPIFAIALEETKKKLLSIAIPNPKGEESLRLTSKFKGFLAPLGMTTAIVLFAVSAVYYLPRLRAQNDVWQDKNFLTRHGFPVKAVDFVKKLPAGAKIFNEFGWGGFFIWQTPQVKMYFDGRGAATWRDANGEFMLKKYLRYLGEKKQLPELSKTPAEYILLEKNRLALPPPGWSDKLFFKKENLAKIMERKPPLLETDLTKSSDWKLIYSDEMTNIWKRTADMNSGSSPE
ncbi:hypothetical protein EPN28_01815 [Patescibacteria group bacterium]|nr:MAG: hypothetical protein EPN28_01815 [Patescibacteria group bacterium]